MKGKHIVLEVKVAIGISEDITDKKEREKEILDNIPDIKETLANSLSNSTFGGLQLGEVKVKHLNK